jgi:GxxExxY protein
MEVELLQRGLFVQRQVALPVSYRGLRVNCGYRIDLLVDDAVIVEVKAIAGLGAIQVAQMITYLKLSGREVGLLINFNVPRLTNGGVRRFVYDHAAGRVRST